MTAKEINTFKSRVKAFIHRRSLRDAIEEIKAMAKRRMAWEVSDKLEKVEQNYAYMLRYVADGANDPERQKVYDQIIADLYGLLDALALFLEKQENPSLYYGTLRVFEMNPDPTRIPRLLARYAEAASKISLFSLVASGNADEEANRREMEGVQTDLFKAIWAKPQLSQDDAEVIGAALANPEFSTAFKTHLVSAITLGLLQQFGARRMQLLIDAYAGCGEPQLTSAALVGLLLGLWAYRDRPLPQKVAARLDAARDSDSWKSDLRIAFIEMIRARDTERINRKIQDEVIPEMLNLKPDILKKISGGQINPNDMASMQENPEWQKLLDENGITDKLKELTEMQMEGGDVMMSTFAHLKQFPFFNEIANWFLPFSASHSQVKARAEKLGVMADMIERAAFLCDNDKYSFMFALDMVPKEQRDLMTSQFQAQSDSIYEQMGQDSSETRTDSRRRTVNAYMQNIYRFFKLFRRKDEFADPFAAGINLISVPVLAADFDDPEMLRIVAEFYFKLGYYDDALDVFMRLEELEPGDASRYQKMGYCCERKGNTQQALEWYQRAELLDSNSRWVLKRLAACYRAAGNYGMAEKYYNQVLAKDPDDLATTLHLAYTLIENGDYDEAVRQLYKIEFLDEKSQKPWRPLAWTLFLTGDFDGARTYYKKILEHSPKPNDYLNMGHVLLSKGDYRGAINYYKLYVQTGDNTHSHLAQAIADDMPALRKAGVDESIVPLILDAVAYSLS